MSRINTFATIEAAPAAAQPLLQGVKQKFGTVPNLFRLAANSPAGLEGYLSLNGALAKGRLSPQTRERLALAIAQVNGCSYCLSAHSYIGKNLAKLDDAEIAANRNGHSNEAKADAAAAFAVAVAKAVVASGRSGSEGLEVGDERVGGAVGVHPGAKELVHGWVLSDFAKGDQAWLNALLDASARALPLLLSGAPDAADRYQAEVMRLAPAPKLDTRKLNADKA